MVCFLYSWSLGVLHGMAEYCIGGIALFGFSGVGIGLEKGVGCIVENGMVLESIVI